MAAQGVAHAAVLNRPCTRLLFMDSQAVIHCQTLARSSEDDAQSVVVTVLTHSGRAAVTHYFGGGILDNGKSH